MNGDVEEAVARAVELRGKSERGRQESIALRTVLRKELAKSRTLLWRARDCRATFTYSRLLARVRDRVLGTMAAREEPQGSDRARLLEDNRQLLKRMRGLEARVSDLLEDRNAFFDAFERYLEIERSLAGVNPRS